MSILASLVKAYDRLPNAPPFGYSMEKIGFIIGLNEDGSVASVTDLREVIGKNKKPRMRPVPYSFKRPGTTPRPFFLWDNANYALGASFADDAADIRFHSFKEKHIEYLQGETDEGLASFRRFIEGWDPLSIDKFVDREEIKDQKVVFALEKERRQTLLHERENAKKLWLKISENWCAVEGKIKVESVCLVTGRKEPIARTHPAIKGIPSKGGKDADSIVSFNLEAFESYGHKQGNNAPVSTSAAFEYTTALNTFLERDSGHRVQLGDASVVFWADATNAEIAAEAESLFTAYIDPESAEKESTKTVGIQLERIRKGDPLIDIEPKLTEGVNFYVLGLAPNAARLSIRFFFEGSFGTLTERYQKFVSDMRVEPPPRDGYPPLWRYLIELAVLGKRENVPPNLAGDWMRSILSGTPYPLTLLSTTLMRIRADGRVNALRVGILKAVLLRNFAITDNKENTQKDPNKEFFVGLNLKNDDTAYVLGRLFAVLEKIQNLALGNINATIRDNYFGRASSSPRTVFPVLLRLNIHHRSKAEKDESKNKLAFYFSKQLTEIMNLLPSEFPAHLSLKDQGKFTIGYYHQINFRKSEETPSSEEPT